MHVARAAAPARGRTVTTIAQLRVFEPEPGRSVDATLCRDQDVLARPASGPLGRCEVEARALASRAAVASRRRFVEHECRLARSSRTQCPCVRWNSTALSPGNSTSIARRSSRGLARSLRCRRRLRRACHEKGAVGQRRRADRPRRSRPALPRGTHRRGLHHKLAAVVRDRARRSSRRRTCSCSAFAHDRSGNRTPKLAREALRLLSTCATSDVDARPDGSRDARAMQRSALCHSQARRCRHRAASPSRSCSCRLAIRPQIPQRQFVLGPQLAARAAAVLGCPALPGSLCCAQM